MHTITIRRGILLGLALAATLSLAACTSGKPPSSAHAGTRHTAPPAARPTSTHAASPPTAAPSATPTGPAVQNLVITSAEKSQLTAAIVSWKEILLSDVEGGGPTPGSVYYAYDPATTAHWALAVFEPSSTAWPGARVSFQDGGDIAMFELVHGNWYISTAGEPPYCGEEHFFPPAVLMAWSMPTAPPAGATC